MTTTYTTNNPDGGIIPVTVEIGPGGLAVPRLDLSRGEVEGGTRAFKAQAYFDTSNVSLHGASKYNVSVEIDVITEKWTAPLRDGMRISRVDQIGPSWDLASMSGGSGPIHEVIVRTFIEPDLE